jgi:hypothetical protein
LASYVSLQANRHSPQSFLTPQTGEAMQSVRSKLTRPVSFPIVMLMLLGYVLMGCMMAEQNRTISAQRDLIHKLFQDTVRLSVVPVNQKRQTRR